MKIRFLDIVIVFLLLFVVYELYSTSIEIKSDGMRCKSNPLVYAAIEYSKLNHADNMIGTATFIKGPDVILRYDKFNLSIESLNVPGANPYDRIDFTNVSFG